MGELGRIPEEKDRGVVEHPVEISFFGLDLDRESLQTCVRKAQIPDPFLAKE